MTRYILRRVLISVPVLLGISLVVFLLVNLQPGDPYVSMIDPQAPPEVKEELLRRVGYYDPIWLKYVKWLGRAASGDLGYSIQYGAPVADIIASRLGNTLTLTVTALALSLLVAIPVGAFGALAKGSLGDWLFTVVAFALLSIPTFFFGMLLIKVFAADLALLPASGMTTVGADLTGAALVRDIATHLVLPAVTLAGINIAVFSRYFRTSVNELIGQDFVRTHFAKGLPRSTVVWRHLTRNSAKPVITILSLEIPALLSGALITETVFSWPGLGRLNYEAVLNRDYQLLMGIVILLAVVTLLANLLADVLYAAVDPRIRVGR